MNISRRNPSKDQVAIAVAATTGYSRNAGESTRSSLAVDAAVAAIEGAGIDRREVDGIIGGVMPGTVATSLNSNGYVQSALGIPAATYFTAQSSSFGYSIVNAVAAIVSGMCDVVLVYETSYRTFEGVYSWTI